LQGGGVWAGREGILSITAWKEMGRAGIPEPSGEFVRGGKGKIEVGGGGAIPFNGGGKG